RARGCLSAQRLISRPAQQPPGLHELPQLGPARGEVIEAPRPNAVQAGVDLVARVLTAVVVLALAEPGERVGLEQLQLADADARDRGFDRLPAALELGEQLGEALAAGEVEALGHEPVPLQIE